MDLTRALSAAPTLSRPRLDRNRGVLIGSRCEACGTSTWPPTAVCRCCGSGAVSSVELGPQGTLLTYSRVWVDRPGLEPGYVLGQILIPGGVRVFAHVRGLRDGAKVPCSVSLSIGEPDALPSFWFDLTEARRG